MSEKELFEKYAEICDHRQRRLMDVQETALFCALRDMLKRGAKQAELVNGPTQSTISHDDWYALCNERDALRADNERLRGDLSETRIALANAECREGVAKERLAAVEAECADLIAGKEYQAMQRTLGEVNARLEEAERTLRICANYPPAGMRPQDAKGFFKGFIPTEQRAAREYFAARAADSAGEKP